MEFFVNSNVDITQPSTCLTARSILCQTLLDKRLLGQPGHRRGRVTIKYEMTAEDMIQECLDLLAMGVIMAKPGHLSRDHYRVREAAVGCGNLKQPKVRLRIIHLETCKSSLDSTRTSRRFGKHPSIY